MSHGPPPSPHDPFGFATVGVANINHPVSRELANSQLGAVPNDMLSMLDSAMYNGFDSLPNGLPNIGLVDDPTMSDATISQTYSAVHTAETRQRVTTATLLPTGEQRFNGSDEQGDMDNVPGAGPSPVTTFGPQPSIPGGSTLTEFTKRRNWPAKVVEELKDFLQILDSNGKIKHVSPNILALTGYAPEDIIDKFLRDLIHPDDVGVFVAELNEAIASGNPLRLFYRLRRKDDSYAIFEAVGHGHIAPAKFAPNPNNQSPFCQAVFMMARPYPTKNAGLLDSLLEHKMENERLMRRISELRKEEADDAEESQRTWRQSQEGRSDIAPSEDTFQTGAGATPFYHGPTSTDGTMGPPDKPASLNIALTRENLEGIAGNRPTSIREKMARYEGVTHADTIEMLTGLRYQEGERSRGITTGHSSPTLIKGDVGIAIPVDRDPRTGEKKKKLKVAEEYVCTDCGTLDSPEWRKGPSGPKTLCNACGLRWAKKEKKRNTNTAAAGGGGSASISMLDH